MKRIVIRSRKGFRRYNWWENFIQHIVENTKDVAIAIPERDRLLAEYNAKLFSVAAGTERAGSYLEFERKEDYVLFLLRWS